jgi:hypothetical protein
VFADVREQRQLAGALDRPGDLVLMPAAGAGDARVRIFPRSEMNFRRVAMSL